MINWFSTKVPRQFSGEREIFSANGARTMDSHMQRKKKKEPWHLPHTTHIHKITQEIHRTIPEKRKV